MLTTEISLKKKYNQVRQQSEKITEPLKEEDMVVQPVEQVSPPKWHLAHTTWFFEKFLLEPNLKNYKIFHPQYSYLFNSYYETAGELFNRSSRGFMTRPTISEVINYRKYVDEAMNELLEEDLRDELNYILEIGLNHEQQHQELMRYDIKYILGNNPLFPEYLPLKANPLPVTHKDEYLCVEAGTYKIGHAGGGFHFDNEKERHTVYLEEFEIMDRLVTNEEYVEFIEDGGYDDFRHWFMEAYEWIKQNKIEAPFHWHKLDGIWHRYALRGGLKPVDPKAPVTHVSMYEAAAFAKWCGKRLPTEFEWEIAAAQYGQVDNGNFVENEHFEPVALSQNDTQFFGDVWEWTNSAYLPYPGYKAPEGALGEYNGKFMINQMVLRGGSCATPANHIRLTYRNYFHPNLRWLFSGFRLAQ